MVVSMVRRAVSLSTPCNGFTNAISKIQELLTNTTFQLHVMDSPFRYSALSATYHFQLHVMDSRYTEDAPRLVAIASLSTPCNGFSNEHRHGSGAPGELSTPCNGFSGYVGAPPALDRVRSFQLHVMDSPWVPHPPPRPHRTFNSM